MQFDRENPTIVKRFLASRPKCWSNIDCQLKIQRLITHFLQVDPNVYQILIVVILSWLFSKPPAQLKYSRTKSQEFVLLSIIPMSSSMYSPRFDSPHRPKYQQHIDRHIWPKYRSKIFDFYSGPYNPSEPSLGSPTTPVHRMRTYTSNEVNWREGGKPSAGRSHFDAMSLFFVFFWKHRGLSK